MTAEVYDFRNASRLGAELDRCLAGWLRAAAGLAVKRWATALSFAAEMHLKTYQLTLPRPFLGELPEDALCLRVDLAGVESATLVVVPRPLSLALLAGMMGETVEGPVEDRALTAIEESLCGYLVETLLLTVLRDAWPGIEPLRLTMGPREADFRNTRLFPPTEPAFAFAFRITGPFGEGEWCWVLPKGDWVHQLLVRPARSRPMTGLPDPKEQLAKLAEQFAVRLSVRLGKADVSLHQLSRLRAGDLILLDQRVHEPLRASVAGSEKFRVWPGTLGARQAVEIHSLLDEH